ncbi:MAG TPA: PTS fructose transporter subunit IIA [Burkholderiaceae bacterium]|nr:PTS fructose transporter subunit IIA [Burkholderiaceae bacterium]
MPAIVVIAHEPLASALVSAAKHVYSRDPCAASRQLAGLDVAPDADTAVVIGQAQALLAQVDRGQGVLVLTDIPGATPGNVAARLAQPGRVAVVAGVNMPMLLRSLCYGDLNLEELVTKALAGGANGIQLLAPAPSAETPTKTA